MELRILYFGVTRDQTKKDEESLIVSQNLSVGEIREKLLKKYPSLDDIQSFALAVNENYADDELILEDGDIVAIIPPVSGG